MRTLRVIVLVCLLVACLPVSPAYAVIDERDVVPADIVAEIDTETFAAYGYTDEGTTVSQVASQMGCSPRVASAVGALVDGWTMGNTRYRFTAAQLANLASAAQSYMVAEGTWDSFADHVDGLEEIAGGVLFDMSPWYDLLGFSSMAEDRSWGSYNSGGYEYSSGMALTAGLPAVSSRAWESTQPGYTPVEVARFRDILYTAGSVIKLGGWNWTQAGGIERLTAGTAGRWACAACLTSGELPIQSLYLVSWGGEDVALMPYQAAPFFPGNMLNHTCPESEVSEASAILHAVLDPTKNPVHRVLLGAPMLSDPAHTVFGSIDAWGIPGVMEPGDVHDSLDFAESWGDDLSLKGDELASKVASMTPGFAEVVDGFASLLQFVGGFFEYLQGFLVAIVLPSPDWVNADYGARKTALVEDMGERFPFSLITIAREAAQEVD